VRARIARGAVVRDAEVAVGRGEVLGVTGLVGSGYEELPYLLAGARACEEGELWIGDRRFDLTAGDVGELLRAGVALVPERREQEGLALELSVLENLTLPRVAQRSSAWRIGGSWQKEEAVAMIERLDIRPPRHDVPVGTLSGGNQQKVQLGKWLVGKPALLLVHEPTHAVDVGARHDIVLAIHDVAAAGCGVVVASSDPQELAVLCDRIVVFREGRVAQELTGRPTPDEIVHATFGRVAA
jgi:ribose transport system ATP-binding protein